MHINYSYYIFDGVVHLKLEGDFIGISNEKIILQIIDTYLSLSIKFYVIELSKINHVNSAGLSYLVRMLNQVKKEKGILILESPSKQVVKLLEITKLMAICTIVNDKKAACQIINHSKLI